MLSPQTFATHLARAVELFRDPGAKDSQKMELRALMGLLRLSPVVLRAEEGKLSINGIVLEGVMYNSLVDRLAKHQVKEISLPSDAPPAEVFNLLKTLADEPSGDDVPKKLESTGTKRVTVEIARLFEEKEEELPPPPPPRPHHPHPRRHLLRRRPRLLSPTSGSRGFCRGVSRRCRSPRVGPRSLCRARSKRPPGHSIRACRPARRPIRSTRRRSRDRHPGRAAAFRPVWTTCWRASSRARTYLPRATRSSCWGRSSTRRSRRSARRKRSGSSRVSCAWSAW